jgi:hypothetical protein
MNTFRTRHQGLSALMRYSLGDHAHLRTYLESDRRVSFEFDDSAGRCADIARTFFESEGAAVSNAKALLDAHRKVRGSVSDAIESDGEWRNRE